MGRKNAKKNLKSRTLKSFSKQKIRKKLRDLCAAEAENREKAEKEAQGKDIPEKEIPADEKSNYIN
ncbi:1542_t:CDS:2 [Funneliformis caledonium]|uniref:1542_t:CDS:1 n=1 Tax=Funneliformis caledonium TaxID=1117310 RepID=A0A9N8WN99_9GLOM|nr:1542_t:CDS:2 [Funneliformis caledonium]